MTIMDHRALIAIGRAPIGGAEIETVDARELHAFLGVGRDFTTWIKERIGAYGFTAGVDFVVVEAGPQDRGAGNRGARTEYAITLDMAKELAMVERNDRGRQARLYFIACEREAKAARTAPAVPQSLPEALRLAADLAEQVERQSAAIAALEPKAAALERLADADGTYCVTDAAKALGAPPRELFSYLRQSRWIYRRDRDGADVAYQDRIEAGLLTHKLVVGDKPDGGQWSRQQVRVTPRGLAKLAQALTPSAAAPRA